MELLDRAPSRSATDGPLPRRGSPADGQRPTRQERLESSRAGRRLLSVLLVATVSAVTLWNLPESEIQATTGPVLRPIVNATGLDQRWNLFAPNPPRRTFQTLARIEYADGAKALWQPPRNDRWRKWLGAIRSERSRRLWEPTAVWIAGHHDSGGRQVVRVELINRSRDLQPPADLVFELQWEEEVFYTLDLSEDGER